MWQDYVISAVCMMFYIALFPQVYRVYKNKNADNFSWITLYMTIIGLFIMSVTFVTMKCYYSAINNLISNGCWISFLVAKYIFRKRGN